jgi:hypothetical protein
MNYQLSIMKWGAGEKIITKSNLLSQPGNYFCKTT